MKICTPLWREAHVQVNVYQTHHSRTTFGSWDVEKVHAVVARSAFPSQECKSLMCCSDHFCKFRCRKSVRRCGAKHISMSRCTRHTVQSTFASWDVENVDAVVARSAFPSQECKSLMCCSDHFCKFRCRKSVRRCGAKHISKSRCTRHTVQSTFASWDVENVDAVVTRSTFRSQKCKKKLGVWHFWMFRCRFRGRRKGLYTLSRVSKMWEFSSSFKYKIHYTTLHNTRLHYTTLHCTTLHYTALHYTTATTTTTTRTTTATTTTTTLHHTHTLHYLHYTTLRSTPVHHAQLHYHSTILRYTTLHWTAQPYTTTTTKTTTTFFTLH